MNNPKPLTLYAHEIRRLLTGEPVLVVRPVKKDAQRVFWNQIIVNGYGGWTDEHGRPCPCPFHDGQCYWVRETWGAWPDWYGGIQRNSLRYKATDNKPDDPHNAWVWRSPVTMPQRYSRLSIVVDDTAVKQVQEIGEDEVEMTGIDYWEPFKTHSTKYCKVYPPLYDGDGVCYSAEECDCCGHSMNEIFGLLHDSHFPDHPYSANPYCWLATVRKSDGA